MCPVVMRHVAVDRGMVGSDATATCSVGIKHDGVVHLEARHTEPAEAADLTLT